MFSSYRYVYIYLLGGIGFRMEAKKLMEWQRNLNNAFAYDLVPSPSVITAALRAARRVNDYPTAVRVFEGMYTRGFPIRLHPFYFPKHLPSCGERSLAPCRLLSVT